MDETLEDSVVKKERANLAEVFEKIEYIVIRVFVIVCLILGVIHLLIFDISRLLASFRDWFLR